MKSLSQLQRSLSEKANLKKIHYCNYKNFSNDIFGDSLMKIFPQNLEHSCDQDVDYFLISYHKILDQYASRKKVCER